MNETPRTETRWKVPRFRLSFGESFVAGYLEGTRAILESTVLTEGVHVRRFEERFAAHVDARYAVAMTNGTTALEFAFRAVGVDRGSVVIPTNTFAATAIAACRAGAKVVLCDMEPDDIGLCPRELDRILGARDDIVAVCPVHVGGIVSRRLPEVLDLCREHGVIVVEDAAHAHGSTLGKRAAGRFGRAGCFSFYPTKVMTTGEGGIVVTDDETVANRLREVKNFGRDPADERRHETEGANAKLTEFQGLFGCLELERAPRRIARRNMLARRYQENLAGTPYRTVTAAGGSNSCYKQIVRTPMTGDALREYCAVRGVDLAGEVYRYPLHEQPGLRGFVEGGPYPESDEFCRHHVCPPLYPELETDEVDLVCGILVDAARELAR